MTNSQTESNKATSRETIDLRIKILYMTGLGFHYDPQQGILAKHFIQLSTCDICDMNKRQMKTMNWLADRHFQFVDDENISNGLFGGPAADILKEEFADFQKAYKKHVKEIQNKLF